MTTGYRLVCDVCGGSGTVPERHDYATEYLGCHDCRGMGVVTDINVENVVALLRFNGWTVTPPM